jgi:hypothetical protein
VQYLIRRWACPTCRRSNATEVTLDGTVKCDHCAAVRQIQPSAAVGDETPDQLSEFIRADAQTQQGEWVDYEPG